MTKDEIYLAMDKIACKLQDLDYLPEFTPAQQKKYDALSEQYDALEIQLKEIE